MSWAWEQERVAMVGMIFIGGLLFAGLAVAAPLAVYTLTLALFGLPHVLSELRYVDCRFGRHIGHNLLIRLGVLLLMIATARTASVFHVIPVNVGLPLELSLVVLLALCVATDHTMQRLIAVAVALTIGLATAFAPFDTAVIFSILHNLTPLGFFWQISSVSSRARLLVPAILGLIGLPLLIATGLPRMVLTDTGIDTYSTDPLHAGALVSHLFVYVPSMLSTNAHAIDYFTASVVAQGGHYLSVIIILPFLLKWIDPNAKGIAPWPRDRWFFVIMAVIAVFSVAKFAGNFAAARGFYGIFASVHAWLEIPILILALTSVPNLSNSAAPAR